MKKDSDLFLSTNPINSDIKQIVILVPFHYLLTKIISTVIIIMSVELTQSSTNLDHLVSTLKNYKRNNDKLLDTAPKNQTEGVLLQQQSDQLA